MKGFCYDIEKKREKKIRENHIEDYAACHFGLFQTPPFFFLEKYGMMLVHLFKVEIP